MSLPENVMRDLLALVESGEASAESQALVEEYAREHSEFARLRKDAGAVRLGLAAAPVPDKEMESLRRTKEMLRLKSILMGVGIFTTLAPFAFIFSNGRLVFFLLRDAPGAAGASLSVAVAAWIGYYALGRSLRTTGL